MTNAIKKNINIDCRSDTAVVLQSNLTNTSTDFQNITPKKALPGYTRSSR